MGPEVANVPDALPESTRPLATRMRTGVRDVEHEGHAAKATMALEPTESAEDH